MLTESVNQKPIQVSKREPSAEAVNSIKKLLTAFPKNLKLRKNFMGPFYGWGSTASRLQPLQGGSLTPS